jgi:dihydrofolate reductase
VFCIGGAQLYADAIPLADVLHLTEIDATFDGETRMPPIDFSEWSQRSRRDEVDAATGTRYAFVDYERVRRIGHG